MMDTSKADYHTGRHVRFTWSGAVRPLRSARLTLCRQFTPSPCPTHYGGRSATSPSDFCSIGDSAAFAVALMKGVEQPRNSTGPFPNHGLIRTRREIHVNGNSKS